MIDIVKDYTAISLGTAQAATARIAGLGRDTAEFVSGRRAADPGGQPLGVFSPRVQVGRARDVARSLLAGDLDGVINTIGLAKRSDLHAVRLQLQRLERRVAEPRGEQ